jgi:hypothetical protein
MYLETKSWIALVNYSTYKYRTCYLASPHISSSLPVAHKTPIHCIRLSLCFVCSICPCCNKQLLFEIDWCLAPILAVLLLERAIWMKDNVIPHGSIIVREFVRLAALHIFLHGQSCLLIVGEWYCYQKTEYLQHVSWNEIVDCIG